MSQIILVTGGSRSGKSAYSQKLAESMPGPRTFIATGLPIDDEMRERIRRHRDARRLRDWATIEEPVDLRGAISRDPGANVMIVDCLTLWINNLMYEAEKANVTLSENDIADRCQQVIEACGTCNGTVVFVTNEIGMGLVPENPVGRLYRDLVGRYNQIMAEASHRVIFLVSGQPLELKTGIVV